MKSTTKKTRIFPFSEFVKHYTRLGITVREAMMVLQHVQYWWEKDRLPFPSNKTIAAQLGVNPRTVQKMKENLRRKKLLIVQTIREKGKQPKTFLDYTPLMEALARSEDLHCPKSGDRHWSEVTPSSSNSTKGTGGHALEGTGGHALEGTGVTPWEAWHEDLISSDEEFRSEIRNKEKDRDDPSSLRSEGILTLRDACAPHCAQDARCARKSNPPLSPPSPAGLPLSVGEGLPLDEGREVRELTPLPSSERDLHYPKDKPRGKGKTFLSSSGGKLGPRDSSSERIPLAVDDHLERIPSGIADHLVRLDDPLVYGPTGHSPTCALANTSPTPLPPAPFSNKGNCDCAQTQGKSEETLASTQLTNQTVSAQTPEMAGVATIAVEEQAVSDPQDPLKTAEDALRRAQDKNSRARQGADDKRLKRPLDALNAKLGLAQGHKEVSLIKVREAQRVWNCACRDYHSHLGSIKSLRGGEIAKFKMFIQRWDIERASALITFTLKNWAKLVTLPTLPFPSLGFFVTMDTNFEGYLRLLEEYPEVQRNYKAWQETRVADDYSAPPTEIVDRYRQMTESLKKLKLL